MPDGSFLVFFFPLFGLSEMYWALCLSWWPDEWSGLREATRSHPHEDKHKAQYCSNKKNDKIEKAILWIERRRSGFVA